MAELKFEFTSKARNGDHFSVVAFKGMEGLSRLFSYELELKLPRTKSSVDLDELLDEPASFILLQDHDQYPVHGILASIDELHTAQGYTYYRANLVPRLWRLSQYITNEIYTDEQKIDEIITLVLRNAGLNDGTDFDFNIDNSNLLRREYRCQFGESDFDFISRLMENEGIYYYFDHTTGLDKIIFQNMLDYPRIEHHDLTYDVGTQTRHLHDSVDAWSCRKQRLPASVSVRDYNPRQPSLDIFKDTQIDRRGHGADYIYGANVIDELEAETLSQIRAEERLCHQTRFYGESSVPRLRTGYRFELDMHPNDAYNGQEYIAIEISHEGQVSDSDLSMTDHAHIAQYRNSFTAISADVHFRPPLTTPRPRFHGTMTAFIFAETGQGQAEIDGDGRYRVLLPFDRADGTRDSNDPERKASAWIRMAQTHVNEAEGDYHPLKGGTEVLLTFINGDPDLPIIIGAVPNAAAPALLTAENSHQSVSKTSGMLVQEVDGGTRKNIKARDFPVEVESEFYEHRATQSDGGFTRDSVDTSTPLSENDGKNHIKRQYGDQYCYTEGVIYNWGADYTINFGNDYEENHESDDADITHAQQFHLTSKMQSLGSTFSDRDYSGWVDGQDGLVEKNWGDKLEFHEGRLFAWSGGQGPGGSLQTYNYGNGYTENLLEPINGDYQGTSADLPANKKEHHDEYTNHSEINDNLGSASLELTFGPTYSYQNGFSLDVKVGDAKSYTWGDSREEVHGDSDSEVHGNSNEVIRGNQNSNVWGRNDEQFMGGSSEIYLAGKAEIGLAAELSMTAGLKTDLRLAGEFELFAGAKIGLSLAADMEVTGISIGAKGIEIAAEGVKLENANAELKAAQAQLGKQEVQLEVITALIQSGAIEIH